MTSTDAPTRSTETICPPWCAGHGGYYQNWRALTDDESVRDHASVDTIIGGFAVTVSAEEHSYLGLFKAQVNLDRDVASARDLTRGEAHELGLALVRAGDAVARWEATR